MCKQKNQVHVCLSFKSFHTSAEGRQSVFVRLYRLLQFFKKRLRCIEGDTRQTDEFTLPAMSLRRPSPIALYLKTL